MKNFTYVNPSSVEEASELLKQPGTVVMGGGTDLLGVLKACFRSIRKRL